MRPLCLLLLLAGCPSPGPDDPDPSDTGAPDTDAGDTDTGAGDTDDTDDTDPPPDGAFVEIGRAAGLSHTQFDLPRVRPVDCLGTGLHGGGAAVGDIDGDGLHDLFFAVYDAPSRLYRNRGDGTFEDVSDRLDPVGTWPTGAGFADVDGDGDLDLAVAHHRQGWLSLLINDGTGRFDDQTAARGLAPPTPEHAICPMNWSVGFGDLDLDGDLDLLVGSWDRDAANAVATPPLVYRNDGTGRFTDASEAFGTRLFVEPFTFTPVVADLDEDGWPDLAMTSDFLTNHWLQGRAEGPPVLRTAGVDDVENGMGAQVVDLDHDGDLDWIITSIFDGRDDPPGLWGTTGNRVYLGDGAGGFTDVSEAWGLREGGWGWGVAAFDADNDGDLDVGWTNGHYGERGARYLIEPFLDDPTTLFLNEGTPAAPRFVEQAADLGIRHTGQGRGYVPFDLENDGDLDLLVVDWADRPRLWRSDTLAEGRHWLTVRVRGADGNTHGIGSTVRVQVQPDGPVVRREIHAAGGYLSYPPAEAHFGLGDHDGPVHRLEVTGPRGGTTVLTEVAADRVLTVDLETP